MAVASTPRGCHAGRAGRCFRQVKDHIQFATPGKVAGFIHETIQGVGGSVQLADGFLSEAYQVPGCRQSCLPSAFVTGVAATIRSPLQDWHSLETANMKIAFFWQYFLGALCRMHM